MLRRQLLRQSRALAHPEFLLPRIQSSSFSQLRQHTTPSLLRSTSPVPPRRWQRWQSTETMKESTDANSVAPGEAPRDSSEAATPTSENPLQKELDAKTKEVVTLKDQYLRSVADYRNLQDRTKRDMDAARQFAIQRFATDLLDSIDNLDRALQTVPAASLADGSSAPASSEAAGTHAQDLRNLHSGLTMTEEILMNTLRKHGLDRFDPLEGEGRRFDPTRDEATFFMKQEGKEDGEVFHTQSKGFTLNGRVIRAAKVGVVKNS